MHKPTEWISHQYWCVVVCYYGIANLNKMKYINYLMCSSASCFNRVPNQNIKKLWFEGSLISTKTRIDSINCGYVPGATADCLIWKLENLFVNTYLVNWLANCKIYGDVVLDMKYVCHFHIQPLFDIVFSDIRRNGCRSSYTVVLKQVSSKLKL
jgi:hypothetical protein